MRAIDPIKAGLVFGILMGLCHLGWALMVAASWAQAIIDFILWMHLIKPIYTIAPFDLGAAVVLVVATTIAGFVLAFVFAMLWNKVHRI